MIFRLITASGIAVFGFAFGTKLAGEEQKRFNELKSVYKLLEYMRVKISISRMPLGDIFAAYPDKDSAYVKEMTVPDRRSHSERWLAATSKSSMTGVPADILSAFGTSLGKLNYENQMRALNSTLSDLKICIDKAAGELSAKIKTYKAISALTGAIIAILLL